MGERVSYYDRIEHATRYPGDALSDISDGMASDKTIVPSCSDQFEFKPALKQHVSFRFTAHLTACLTAYLTANLTACLLILE